MARRRGEPAIVERSKSILESPVFPNAPTNTPTTPKPVVDPDLAKDEQENPEDLNDDVD